MLVFHCIFFCSYNCYKLCRSPAQYAPTQTCKLTVSSYLFTRWRCCFSMTLSSYLFARWHLFRHVGYLRHQQVDLLTMKVVFKSHVTWATSVPILVFLGLSVLDLGLMYTTDVRQHHRLMPPGLGHNNWCAWYSFCQEGHPPCKISSQGFFKAGCGNEPVEQSSTVVIVMQ